MTHLFHYCNLLANKQLLEKRAPGTHCTLCEQHAAPWAFLQLQQINVIGLKKNTWISTEVELCLERHRSLKMSFLAQVCVSVLNRQYILGRSRSENHLRESTDLAAKSKKQACLIYSEYPSNEIQFKLSYISVATVLPCKLWRKSCAVRVVYFSERRQTVSNVWPFFLQ